jgi:hypothetical protein
VGVLRNFISGKQDFLWCEEGFFQDMLSFWNGVFTIFKLAERAINWVNEGSGLG